MYENIVRFKIKAIDGKFRETDTLDTKGILRLIESVPSPKAARDDLEKKLGKTIISDKNSLSYKYMSSNKLNNRKILEKDNNDIKG